MKIMNQLTKPTADLAVFLLIFALLNEASSTTTKHYIVYMGEHSFSDSDSVISSNHEMLASITGSIPQAEDAAIHHYSKSFRGFSAILTPEQAQKLSETESVISVFESTAVPLHTTHSWEFLGINAIQELNQSMPDEPQSDVIVGSESFNDEGLGPIPKRFKGECIIGDQFTVQNCNRKIIGARYYYEGFEAEFGPLESRNRTFIRSVRDTEGHGTHVASTIAGSLVNNASLFGIAIGTARGGSPNARLAIYKPCWFSFCNGADVLSALDDAIEDGVDVISLSLGPPPTSYFSDVISIGSFHAFKKGILVSASAGNSGTPGTACNVPPWILTVAASSTDRELNSNVLLGNSKVLKGSSINSLKMETKSYGIITASAAAAKGVPARNASLCMINTLDPNLIKGKIVVCTAGDFTDARIRKSIVIRQGGGAGMILIDPIFANDVGFQFFTPTILIGETEAEVLFEYLNTTNRNPTAKFYPTMTVLNTRPAPVMASFSSMGPNILTPEIIKPDITAPGVNILAAWSPLAVDAEGSVNYYIISGTSMSCPHISGVAAFIKSRRPAWSPSAIKSAIMTTATVMDNTWKLISKDPNGSPTTPFDYGSGHVNPLAALDPGLIYDFGPDDIIDFICTYGATAAQFRNLTTEPITCKNPPIPTYNLNYPSIGVTNMNGTVTVLRTATYWGHGSAVFTASVENPAGVEVFVKPNELMFKETGEKLSYEVEFTAYRTSNGSFVFGSIIWKNGAYKVRSPIGLNVTSI
ncbi:hypothetical protein C5167_044982 [Papaver somniferum]|uniref:Uncharacterized protein n=1 Tax=Papaver somniferum TaxID=3469 RepID=A0A4Y7LCD7_PAPSO|nr:hypothetical protein C5167_044982 [Papaver somniferum]